jgi:hypothetical protein
MTEEGLRFVIRVGLVLALIVVIAVVRTAVGPSRQRGRIMLAGTLGGLVFGLLLSSVLFQLYRIDISVFTWIFGVLLGWRVAWTFARRIPREAS